MKENSSLKTKILAGVALVSAVASSASAAVTMNADGTVTGSLNTEIFMGIASLVITACAVMWSAKRAIALIR